MNRSEEEVMLAHKAARLGRVVDRERTALLLALFVGLPLLAMRGVLYEITPVAAVVAVAIAAAVAIHALVYVPKIPRLVLSGLVGGGGAGLVALGVGSRLVMRVVSVTGGRREVTVGGTMFLLVAGAMLGAMIGINLAGLLRLWRVRGWAVGAVLMVLFGSPLLLGRNTRAELFDEGLGIWLNLPIFLGIFFLFGLAAVPSIRMVDARLPIVGRARSAIMRPAASGR